MKGGADLAGIFITDEIVDVIVGSDEPDSGRFRIADLRVEVTASIPKPINVGPGATSSSEAFAKAIGWIKEQTGTLRGLGIGCYGPFVTTKRADIGQPGYGRLNKPTHGSFEKDESIYDLATAALSKAYSKPPQVFVQHDVTVAALGEFYQRSTILGHQTPEVSQDTVTAFVKLSYGIGCAVIAGAHPFQGRLQSEVGQIYVPRWNGGPLNLDPNGEEATFTGSTEYAGRIESLANVAAIEKRWGQPFELLKKFPQHPAWHRESWYAAQLCQAITMMFAPSHIILGGRIMRVEGLLDKVRRDFNWLMGVPKFPTYDELEAPNFLDRVSSGKPGLFGALCLAAIESRPGNISPILTRTKK